MSRINKTQYAILGQLSQGRMSGYDLKVELKKALPYVWAESNAQIYPMLKKLESEGSISSRIDPDSGLRQRKIYSITSNGLNQLEAYLAQPIQFSAYREELLLKLHLSDHMPEDKAGSHLSSYIKHLNEHLSEITSELTNDEHNQITRDYAKSVIEAQLKWAKRTQASLKH